MMVEKSFERIYIALAGIWIFILVWSAVLGLPNFPAWNAFVTWVGRYVPRAEGVVSFFDNLHGIMAKVPTMSGEDLQRLANPDAGDTATIFTIIAGMWNAFVVFLRGIGTIIVFVIQFGYNLITFYVPLFAAFVAFLSGSVVLNFLPGAQPVIDWSANSGWLGYPDQSFVAFVASSVPLVG